MRRYVVVLALMVGVLSVAAAQPAGAVDLKKSTEGEGFVHEPSQIRFTVPQGWEVVPPKQEGKSSFMGVRRSDKNLDATNVLDVTLSWSPLTVKMDGPDGAIDLQLRLLNTLYGQDKVGKPDNVTVNERPGTRIIIDNGPTLDGKEAGAIYLFEQVVDEKTRWKVKVRATFSKLTKEQSVKMLDELVKNIKW